MNYSNELKCNPDIFEIFKPIRINEDLIITWLYHDELEIESKMLFNVSKSLEVKNFLPGIFVNSETEAKKKFVDLLGRQIHKQALIFCIRITKTKMPIGYVMLNSPTSEYNLNEWVLDFWLMPQYRGGNIMTHALYNILNYSKGKGINLVLAQVNTENKSALVLLTKLGFGDVSEQFNKLKSDQKMLCVPL
jgi:RimJ/RimL family protein N-acetyltransferase